MSFTFTSSRAWVLQARGRSRLDGPTLVAAAASIAFFAIGAHALGGTEPYDVGFYYRGAVAAWDTGLPASVDGWLGTPFMAALLAPIAAQLSMVQVAVLVTFVNVAILAVACVALSRVLTPIMGRGGGLLFAVATTILFAPAVSTLWWRQFNLIAVAVAIAGFVQLRRGRGVSAALLIAVSVALKPLVVLLPVALLLRRETRRVGAIALLLVGSLTMAAQTVLVMRGAPPGTLNPIRLAHDTMDRMSDPAGSHACHPGNLSPSAFLCRSFAPTDVSVQRGLGFCVAVVVATVLLLSVRRYAATSYEYFAMAAAGSVMFGPIEWTHYQVVLVPLIVVVAMHLWAKPRAIAATIFLLALTMLMLVWSPSMVVPDAVAHWTGTTPIHASFVLMRLTAFAQLVLFSVAVVTLRADAPLRAPDRTAMDNSSVRAIA